MTTAPDIRILPPAEPRVETGAVQFGDDWPGVFFRGDSAGYFAMQLAQALRGEAAASMGPFNLLVLRHLQSTLAGAVVGPAASLVAMDAEFDGLPEDGQYFRHAYGGLYRKKGTARYSEDGQTLVVYEHLWPFERGDWARPETQWAGRFTPVALSEVRTAMKGDRLADQASVAEAKRQKRATSSPSA